MLKHDHDSALDVFDQGCLVLRRNGQKAGHVATALSTFWSPGRPFTMQDWVWFIVVWSNGERERSFEDYPPWTFVNEIQNGVFVWHDGNSHSGEYSAEWLPDSERQEKWAELGVTLSDF
jgi:hypothetical protein